MFTRRGTDFGSRRSAPSAISLWLAAALLACPLLLAGQTSQNQPPNKIAVESKIVTVYATVRDKHGKIVGDLNKDDFALTEDGHPEAITNFAHQTDLPLTLGLLVDTSGSQRDVIGDERDASYSFLDHMLRDKDRAFLIHFDHEVELLQDLTSSHQKLQTALQQLDAPEMRQAGQGDPDPGQRSSHGGTLLYDAIYLASNELMRKQQGRKAIIVLTDGVDRGSKETLEDAVEAAQRADTIVYSIYFPGHEGQGGPQRGYGHHGGMGGGWPGGGGGWPGGGGGGGGYPRPSPQEEKRPDGKKILERLSSQTGGQMFEVSKKLKVSDIYAQIQEELRNQYVLGYPPDKANAETSYHKIVVTTKQKDLAVHARDGYYSGS